MFRVTGAAILALGIIQFGFAYSDIWSVSGWDTDRLEKAGITVRAWDHDPPIDGSTMKWVEVSFDCFELSESIDVIITASINDEEQQITAFRAERAGSDHVTLVFAVQPEFIDHSSLMIRILRDVNSQDKKRSRTTTPLGYRLTAKRILELAYGE